MGAPLLILGVRRSGTTLLRVMLDRNPELAVPDESYFIPQLADRHAGKIDPDAFVDDLRRLPTLLEWGVDSEDVRRRLRPGMPVGDAIGAVYESYAAAHGKSRWGDKTPMYMRHLTLLERLFPEARYVHLIRDGRDAALSFLQMPDGVVTKTWAHPTTAADFACQWRTEVEAAQALGSRVGASRYLEVRYEDLVESPELHLQEITEFAGLSYDPGMLGYAGQVDLTGKPHQQSLVRPPTPGSGTGAGISSGRTSRASRRSPASSAKPRLRACDAGEANGGLESEARLLPRPDGCLQSGQLRAAPFASLALPTPAARLGSSRVAPAALSVQPLMRPRGERRGPTAQPLRMGLLVRAGLLVFRGVLAPDGQ